MTLTWTKENSPRWDADKQRVLGPAELAAVGLAAPLPGEPVANEWWRVTEGDEVAGCGRQVRLTRGAVQTDASGPPEQAGKPGRVQRPVRANC